MSHNDDPDEENRHDFAVLTRQLASQAPSSSGQASVSISPYSNSSSTVSSQSRSTSNQEIWPLQLNALRVEHYIFGDVIGNGSYAEVRECIDTKSLERCAVKIVNKEYLKRQNPSALMNQQQEIKLLRHLSHQNIIALKECLYKGTKIYIILEHCTFVLSDILSEQQENRLTVSLARNLFNQLICGIQYLHSVGVVHRDIKPQNLLIKTCGTLKIIDFGVSQILSIWSPDDRCSNYEGSPLFQAPEVVSGQREYSGYKVDIWSAGVTLYLILVGYHPFSADTLLNLYDKILGDDLHIPSTLDPVIGDLLSIMLDKVPSRRASIEQVIAHPWLNLTDPHESHDASGQQSEFVELTQSNSNMSSSGREPDPDSASNKSNVTRDIYRSMSVLPYLHSYHYPQYSATRAKKGSILTRTIFGGGSETSTDAGSSTTTDSPASSPASSLDPHEVISDEPIEWGTENQYNLLKVPLIRANRVRTVARRRGRGKSKGRSAKVVGNK